MVSENLNIDGGLLVNENSTFLKEVTIDGSLILNSNLMVSENLNIDGGLLVNENSTFLKEVVINQEGFFKSDVTVDGELQINGILTINSNLNVNGLFVDGEAIVKQKTFLRDDLHVSSNVEIDGNLLINADVYVESNVNIHGALDVDKTVTFKDTFSIRNDEEYFFKVEGSNLFLHDEMYKEIGRHVKININSSNLTADMLISNVTVNSTFHKDLTVKGNFTVESTLNAKSNVIVNGEVALDNKLQLLPLDTNNQSWWNIYCDASQNETYEADLLFESRNGSKMTFHDQFEESIINFTGQHRCSIIKNNEDKDLSVSDLVGRIVISTGEYQDLHNKSKIRINEAIPKVKLCNLESDKRVFGVISGEEEIGKYREFKFGNLSFFLNKDKNNKKVMINSVGEGGIWVCNVNGSLENGDYITTSDVDGYGMRQNDNIQRNYTVAKITCDCDFDLYSDIYKCEEIIINNKKARRAFVGCIYYC
jgi:cytoskeletal protein CcmA (bactofilin family)